MDNVRKIVNVVAVDSIGEKRHLLGCVFGEVTIKDEKHVSLKIECSCGEYETIQKTYDPLSPVSDSVRDHLERQLFSEAIVAHVGTPDVLERIAMALEISNDMKADHQDEVQGFLNRFGKIIADALPSSIRPAGTPS